jgi:hypothetical protein
MVPYQGNNLKKPIGIKNIAFHWLSQVNHIQKAEICTVCHGLRQNGMIVTEGGNICG